MLAMIVGAVVFRSLIKAVTLLFTGHMDYAVLGCVPDPLIPGLGVWYVLFVPVNGSAVFGNLVLRSSGRDALRRGHGLRISGGCCGTDAGHLEAIAVAVRRASAGAH